MLFCKKNNNCFISTKSLCNGRKWRLGIKEGKNERREERGWSGDGPLSPCARGRAREGDAWLAGHGEAPAPAAPGVVEEEEEGVVETGPLDTTTHRRKHTQDGSMAH